MFVYHCKKLNLFDEDIKLLVFFNPGVIQFGWKKNLDAFNINATLNI